MTHRLTELRERLDYEPRPSPLAWVWMRLKASDTSKRAHRMRREGDMYVGSCGFQSTTRAELLVEDAAALKCVRCVQRERRGNGINRREQ